MSQLTMASIPGFFDQADAVLAGGNPLTDDAIIKIQNNAKFAAVRCEFVFMGWYKNGDTVPLPISPVDGYAYTAAECRFFIEGFSTQPPSGTFVSGQANTPTGGPSTGTKIDAINYWVTQSTRVVHCNVYYDSNGAQSDGMLKITACCQRSSVNNDT